MSPGPCHAWLCLARQGQPHGGGALLSVALAPPAPSRHRRLRGLRGKALPAPAQRFHDLHVRPLKAAACAWSPV